MKTDLTKPSLTKIDLFEARTGGYHICRIPGLVVTRNGVILAYAEGRITNGSDWDNINVVMRRSLDNGVTWEEPKVLVYHSNYGEGPANNPCAIADHETGSVHFLYCFNYARVFYMKSDDDGATFSDPVEITSTFEQFRSEYDWGVMAVGPGHGIQLRNGRLVAPVWLSESKTKAHRPNRCAVIYSDDHGATWQCGDIVPDEITCCNETEAVQLHDGSVLLNMRNMGEERRRAVTISSDGATGWSTPVYDEALVEPRCFASICRFTEKGIEDRNRILFSNPDNLFASNPNHKHGFTDRVNVSIRMSYDECQTWEVSRSLEPGPSGYSDLAVAADKTILCFYERGSSENMFDTRRLTLARLNLEWLTDGADHLM